MTVKKEVKGKTGYFGYCLKGVKVNLLIFYGDEEISANKQPFPFFSPEISTRTQHPHP